MERANRTKPNQTAASRVNEWMHGKRSVFRGFFGAHIFMGTIVVGIESDSNRHRCKHLLFLILTLWIWLSLTHTHSFIQKSQCLSIWANFLLLHDTNINLILLWLFFPSRFVLFSVYLLLFVVVYSQPKLPFEYQGYSLICIRLSDIIGLFMLLSCLVLFSLMQIFYN